MNFPSHEHYMRMALRQAREALEEQEVPTGCAIIHAAGPPGEAATRVVGLAHNQVEQLTDPTAHAEMIAITQAATALGDWRLADCTLYVTKEPCAMCAGAIILARIPTVIYGVPDPRRGGGSVFSILDHPALNHRCAVRGGVMEEECRELLQEFFRARRAE